MSFIQTISYTTTRFEEMRALTEQYQQENADAPGLVAVKVLKDRDRQNAYLVIAEFDSYEHAMQNSARTETDSFARQMSALSETGPDYGNYDLVQEFH